MLFDMLLNNDSPAYITWITIFEEYMVWTILFSKEIIFIFIDENGPKTISLIEYN